MMIMLNIQVVELLSSINNNNRDRGGEEEEADDDLKVGGEVDLVFLDQEMAMEHQQAWGPQLNTLHSAIRHTVQERN